MLLEGVDPASPTISWRTWIDLPDGREKCVLAAGNRSVGGKKPREIKALHAIWPNTRQRNFGAKTAPAAELTGEFASGLWA